MLLKIFFLLTFYSTLAQKTFLEFHYPFPNNNINDSFVPSIKKAYRNPIDVSRDVDIDIRLISFKKNKKERISFIEAEIGKGSTFILNTGYYGAEIFLKPNDTDFIKVTVFDKLQKYLIDSIPNYNIFFYHHSGRSINENQFFDSLAYTSGTINISSVSFKQANYNIDQFFFLSKNEYNLRLQYLKDYHARHPLPNHFYQISLSEINSSFIYNLLSPLTNPVFPKEYQILSQEYKDSINTFKLNDSVSFFNTVWYSEASKLYNNCILQKMDYSNYYSSQQLQGRFAAIQKNFDPALRDEVLTSLMLEFLKKGNENYDSLFTVYNGICENISYKHFVDSSYRENKINTAITKQDVFGTAFTTVGGKKKTLAQIIKNRPTVIDCWASWCKPCIEQFLFQKKIDSLYGNKINFVTLSFDKNKSAWLRRLKQLNLNTNLAFLLPQNFSSLLAKYFDITSIPFYIFIDKHGIVNNIYGLRPSNTKKFIEQLNKIIK